MDRETVERIAKEMNMKKEFHEAMKRKKDRRKRYSNHSAGTEKSFVKIY